MGRLLKSIKKSMKAIIKLLRPHQYIKNTFVFIGLLFSHLWSSNNIVMSVWAFFAFSMMASAVYVLNDLMDLEADKAHPKKCKRPLPSGQVPIKTAKILMVLLVGLSLAPLIAAQKWMLVTILSIYFVTNIAYSITLKHIVLLDVFIISFGFMLRILAGTIGIDIAPTEWLLLCGMMLTLFLGFSKRTSELMQSDASNVAFKGETRKVLTEYNYGLLNQLTAVCAACTVMSFGLYTVSEATIALHQTDKLIYTLPFVIYGIFRYLYLTQRHAKGTDTSRDLLTDRHLLLTAIFWGVSVLGILI